MTRLIIRLGGFSLFLYSAMLVSILGFMYFMGTELVKNNKGNSYIIILILLLVNVFVIFLFLRHIFFTRIILTEESLQIRIYEPKNESIKKDIPLKDIMFILIAKPKGIKETIKCALDDENKIDPEGKDKVAGEMEWLTTFYSGAKRGQLLMYILTDLSESLIINMAAFSKLHITDLQEELNSKIEGDRVHVDLS